MELGFEILYDEGPCVVVNKPPGVPTQAAYGIDSLEVRIKEWLRQGYCRERNFREGNTYLGIAHRLDRPASGAIVFGKHNRATRRLAEQFQGRQVKKVYWVGVEGIVTPSEGIWEDYVRKIPDVAAAEVVPPDHPDARHAVLQYRTLTQTEGVTWLEIRLHTGRTHQIRIQASSRGYPVVGDSQYGAAMPFGVPNEDPRMRAIALHARHLAFVDPMTRLPVEVRAATADYWPSLTDGPEHW